MPGVGSASMSADESVKGEGVLLAEREDRDR
jgi:hypothetical protein